MDYRLECKTQIPKIPRRKYRGSLPDIGLGDDVLNLIPEVKATKTGGTISYFSAQKRKPSTK